MTNPYGQSDQPAAQYGGYPSHPGAGVGTSGLAIASIVTGIITFVVTTLSWLLTLGILGELSVVGVLPTVLGHIALRHIKRTGSAGRGAAITGVVLGWLQIFGLALWLLLAVSIHTS